MNEKNKNCGNCKFAANMNAETSVGCCRRFPPTLMVQPLPTVNLAGEKSINWNQQASAYPMIANSAWCGEHQDAPAAIFNS